MKIVVDANVFVSAAIAKGAPHDLVMRWLRGADFEIVLCPMLIDDIETVLVTRESLRRYIPQGEAEEFVMLIARANLCRRIPQRLPLRRGTREMTISYTWRRKTVQT